MANLVRDVEGASNSLFCLHQQALNPDNEWICLNKTRAEIIQIKQITYTASLHTLFLFPSRCQSWCPTSWIFLKHMVLHCKFVDPHHGPDITNGISATSAVIPWCVRSSAASYRTTNISKSSDLESVQQRELRTGRSMRDRSWDHESDEGSELDLRGWPSLKQSLRDIKPS